jgi:hypothetical protein
MFHHDLRRLALARDLLAEAARGIQLPASGTEAERPEQARTRDTSDRGPAHED